MFESSKFDSIHGPMSHGNTLVAPRFDKRKTFKRKQFDNSLRYPACNPFYSLSLSPYIDEFSV